MGTITTGGQSTSGGYNWVVHAERVAKRFFDIDVRADADNYDLNKFGMNDNLIINVWQTVWNVGGDETYATADTIDSISSSDATDSEVITIEGHTLDATGFTFIVQNATLNGQTPVTLTTPLARVSKAFNSNGVLFSGSVYIYESGGTVTAGVPQDVAKIHIQVLAEDQESNKCVGTMSKADAMFITGINCFANKKSSGQIDFQLQVREYGKIFRTIFRCSSSSTGSSAVIRFEPYIIVPPNADFRVRANPGSQNMSAEASLNTLLASVV